MSSKAGQDGTAQDAENRTVTGQTTGQTSPRTATKPQGNLSKTHQDYWLPKLKKRSYIDRSGQRVQIADWQVRLFHAGRESWFNTSTPNRVAAAIKARDIYLSLISRGWGPTLQQFKPDDAPIMTACTVGEFLGQVKALSGLKPGTFEIYAKKFRSLVAGVFNLHGNAMKHDYVNGGHDQWLNRVHAVRLSRLTPERVNKWKARQLGVASKNPLDLKRAHITIRSILLSSKALFSPKKCKHLSIQLPARLPFDGVELPKAKKSRYKSEINPDLLYAQAVRELAEGWQGDNQPLNPRPELFKIFLLALYCGLRRDEIDTLQWKQVQWHRNAIVVETTEYGGTKSDDSEADVNVAARIMEALKGYLPKPGEGSPFVIESPVQPRPSAMSYHHYRCSRLFKEMVLWLRSKGVNARNALHSLRKEYGSQVCKQAGIFAASSALRHSNITITRDHYVDQKNRVVYEPPTMPSINAAEPDAAQNVA